MMDGLYGWQPQLAASGGTCLAVCGIGLVGM